MEKIILTNMCLIENPQTNEVVVIHRVKNWKGIDFPGGHIEQGEEIVPSVIREVKEETNLDISHLTFCGIRDWYDKTTNERTIVFMFRTKTYKGILETDNVGVDVIATDISDLKIYSKKSNNVMIVEETLEETMAKFASVMPREKKERKLCDLFDYRKWTKNIEALIG